jgi:hypothetical protein
MADIIVDTERDPLRPIRQPLRPIIPPLLPRETFCKIFRKYGLYIFMSIMITIMGLMLFSVFGVIKLISENCTVDEHNCPKDFQCTTPEISCYHCTTNCTWVYNPAMTTQTINKNNIEEGEKRSSVLIILSSSFIGIAVLLISTVLILTYKKYKGQ